MTPEEKKLLGEQQKQKVAALHKSVNENVERIQSSAEFRNFLVAMSRFHDYSWNNQMLIWIQRRDTTHVAGFNAWKDLGRKVKKDEHGIAILAPLGPASATTWTRATDGARYTIKRSDRGYAIYDDNETVLEDGFASYAAAARRLKEMGFVEHKEMLSVNNFKVVYVYDIAQTEGKPLPEFDVPVLTGEANRPLFDGLRRLAEDQGVTVSFEPMPSQDPGIKGFFRPPNYVWVRPEEAPAQQLKTLLHELAHYYTERVFNQPKADAETIAESAACVVGAYYGFDTGVRSFPYIALWARDGKVLRANLNSVQEVSERIIDTLEKRTARLMPEPPARPVDKPTVSPVETDAEAMAARFSLTDIKQMARDRGLDISGSKSDIIKRIIRSGR